MPSCAHTIGEITAPASAAENSTTYSGLRSNTVLSLCIGGLALRESAPDFRIDPAPGAPYHAEPMCGIRMEQAQRRYRCCPLPGFEFHFMEPDLSAGYCGFEYAHTEYERESCAVIGPARRIPAHDMQRARWQVQTDLLAHLSTAGRCR